MSLVVGVRLEETRLTLSRFGAVDRHWKVKYIPLCLATGVCPDSPRAFFSQQMRWARGSTTLLTNGHFWVSNLNFMQKICYLSGECIHDRGLWLSPNTC